MCKVSGSQVTGRQVTGRVGGGGHAGLVRGTGLSGKNGQHETPPGQCWLTSEVWTPCPQKGLGSRGWKGGQGPPEHLGVSRREAEPLPGTPTEARGCLADHRGARPWHVNTCGLSSRGV